MTKIPYLSFLTTIVFLVSCEKEAKQENTFSPPVVGEAIEVEGNETDSREIISSNLKELPEETEIVEEGLVVKGKAKPLKDQETNPVPTDSVDKLPPLKEGSIYKPLAFRDLTNFEYLVEWEADGKDFDFSAYAKRVPSRLREKSGAKVAVEGFMIPTVVDENNKVKEFLLLPDQMSCCFGKSPEANGWLVVTASNGVEVLMDRIIRATGTLTVEERWDEEFFVGLYHMDCKEITGPAL